MRTEIRVNRIDGRDVKEWRWVCTCGLPGPWRGGKIPSFWDLEELVAREHATRAQEVLAQN